MRTFILLFCLLVSLPSMAISSDRSEHMVAILKEHKVPAYGRRQEQQASLSCKIPKKDKLGKVKCLIVVTPIGFNELNTVYDVLTGEFAIELSELLKEFGVKPEGKNANQSAEMICRLPKVLRPDSLPVCGVIPVELLRD